MCHPTLLDPLQTVDSAATGCRAPCRVVGAGAAWAAASRALSLHHSPPHQLACCLWQTGARPPLSYLIYRWSLFLAVLSIGVASFACQELPKNYHGPVKELNYYKWFIYFTNWGYMLIIIQAGLAVILVHKYRNDNNILGKEIYNQKSVCCRTPLVGRLYWLSQTVAADLAFVITLIYWTMVHDPELHEVNALNLLVHVGNSVVMACEVCVTTHCLRAAHAVHSAAAGLAYGLFSAVYWLAGGTDRLGERAIYPPLNWEKPGSALCFVGVCAAAVVLAHAVTTALATCRTRLPLRPDPLTLPTH